MNVFVHVGKRLDANEVCLAFVLVDVELYNSVQAFVPLATKPHI